jgi:two-component system, NtrC family, response regulator HydG
MPAAEAGSAHGIVGRSAPMRALLRLVERVAPLDVAVLILGETGTGKELVARAIQRLSRRRDGPFEIVNCGALTRELLVSELFGHERGAFTGAVARKDGRLALADGGTIFLDEVGELPLDAQAMLLRFLQWREIQPLGSTQTLIVDVRVIAATNLRLEWAIERGSFRGDLYYRLFDMAIEVPPLRARREDLPLLVEHIRAQTNARCELAIDGVTPEALALIDDFPWPGNVRELEAVVRRAMILRGTGWVAPGDLNLGAVQFPGAAPAHGRARGVVPQWRPPLTGLERQALRLAGRRRGLRTSEFMARCGLSRHAAWRALARLVKEGLLKPVGIGKATRYVTTPAGTGLLRPVMPA